jgi:hypothetical protein
MQQQDRLDMVEHIGFFLGVRVGNVELMKQTLKVLQAYS